MEINTKELVKFAQQSEDCYSISSFESTSGDSCRYTVEDTNVIIAFKGSKTGGQWLLNLISPLVLHSGQMQGESVREMESKVNLQLVEYFAKEVLARLDKELPNKKSRIFTLCGHSRGGLLATICGAYLLLRGEVVNRIYTFGSPHVYQKYNLREEYFHLKDSVQSVLVNVEHTKDLVPHSLDLLASSNDFGECITGNTVVSIDTPLLPLESTGWFDALANAALNAHSMTHSYIHGVALLDSTPSMRKLMKVSNPNEGKKASSDNSTSSGGSSSSGKASSGSSTDSSTKKAGAADSAGAGTASSGATATATAQKTETVYDKVLPIVSHMAWSFIANAASSSASPKTPAPSAPPAEEETPPTAK